MGQYPPVVAEQGGAFQARGRLCDPFEEGPAVHSKLWRLRQIRMQPGHDKPRMLTMDSMLGQDPRLRRRNSAQEVAIIIYLACRQPSSLQHLHPWVEVRAVNKSGAAGIELELTARPLPISVGKPPIYHWGVDIRGSKPQMRIERMGVACSNCPLDKFP